MIHFTKQQLAFFIIILVFFSGMFGRSVGPLQAKNYDSLKNKQNFWFWISIVVIVLTCASTYTLEQ